MPRGYKRITSQTKIEKEEQLDEGTIAEQMSEVSKRSSDDLKDKSRVRQVHKKTRTGCITCRARRVKCDERWPACERCIKFGWECEGYRNPPREETESRSTPFSRRQTRPLARRPEIKPKLHSINIHSQSISMDETQRRYFQHYCEEFAPSVRYPNVTSLWEQIIPQAGEAEQCISHAIIAIGALTISFNDSRVNQSTSYDSHLHFAFIEYDKALHGMLFAIQNQTQDRRKALLACLLVFCLECLFGHSAAASQFAFSGVTLFFCSDVGKTSSESDLLLEDDLESAFNALDLQSLSYVKESMAHHRYFKDGLDESLRRMPNIFTSLDECKKYSDMITRRNCHYLALSRDDFGLADPFSPEPSFFKTLPWTIANMSTPEDNLLMLPEIMERDQYFGDIHRWNLASSAILSGSNLSCKEQIISHLMKIQCAVNIIILSRKFCQVQPPELIYDNHLADFQTIIALCSSIKELYYGSDFRQSSRKFRIDIDVVLPLTITANYCRDKNIRADAIERLLGSGTREGIWDALSEGTIADFKRNIEEEFMDESGFIPGNRRANMLRKNVNLPERYAEVAFEQCVGDDLEDFVVREAVLCW